jgi:hypothetical protein
MQTFTLDLATLKPHQRKAFLALVESLFEPYFIPVMSDEEMEKYPQKA